MNNSLFFKVATIIFLRLFILAILFASTVLRKTAYTKDLLEQLKILTDDVNNLVDEDKK